MAKVTVFHGTTIERARKIIKDKTIKPTSSDIARYDDTTEGYVYVTKRFCDALDFSTRPIANENTLIFVVFKIMIEETELLYDDDEEKWISTLSDDGATECFRVQRELHFYDDVVAVFCKKMNSHNTIGNYMQAVQFGKIEVKESEWKNICHDKLQINLKNGKQSVMPASTNSKQTRKS